MPLDAQTTPTEHFVPAPGRNALLSQIMRKLLQHFKPTDQEIRKLALDETDPRRVHRYEPIARGPVFALIAIPAVVLLALPSCLVRLLRGALRARWESA